MSQNDILEPVAVPRPLSGASAHPNLATSIGKNTVFGVVARLAQVGTRLITLPIVIAHLGLGGYGIWAIIMTAGAYMRFGSVGIKSAFQKYVAEATGNGDYETANKLLSTGTAAMAILSVAGLVPTAFFSHRLAQMAGVPAGFLTSAAGAISMLAVVMMISNVGAAFEATVMGAHRIDLARKFTTIFTIAEAVAIVILLHMGFGLFALAAIMGLSELGFIACCSIAARKVAPQIHVKMRHVTLSVIPELVRYAGSYQMVNILEVVYGAIVPIALLRVFGADAAGVFAIAGRLQGSAGMLPDSMLLPILSGGAMVFASGSITEMRRLIGKAFKVTLGLTLFPTAFFAVFGTMVLYAWTGTTNPSYELALCLVGLNVLLSALSLLGLVLYRVSGRALLDNIRQVLRIVIVLSVGLFAKHLGFAGVLAGLAGAEFVGMIFMGYAMSVTFEGFRARDLARDFVKLTVATAAILAVGALASRIPLPHLANARLLMTLRLGLGGLGCLAAAWPALYLTGSVTAGEGQMLIKMFLPRRFRPAPGV
jgi:O-antigen/teichoic acid export membrane protein